MPPRRFKGMKELGSAQMKEDPGVGGSLQPEQRCPGGGAMSRHDPRPQHVAWMEEGAVEFERDGLLEGRVERMDRVECRRRCCRRHLKWDAGEDEDEDEDWNLLRRK